MRLLTPPTACSFCGTAAVPLAAGGREHICEQCVARFRHDTGSGATRCSFCNRELGARRVLRQPLRAAGNGLEPEVVVCSDCVGIAGKMLANERR